MLHTLLTFLFRDLRAQRQDTQGRAHELLEQGHEAMRAADFRGAIVHLTAYLQQEPYDVVAINDLGYCYGCVGDNIESARLFDQAYALDSAYLPGVVNHAKLLADKQRSEEALPLLRLVKAQNPDFPNADAVMASVRQGRGEISAAIRHAKEAWLKQFDNLRLANSYLFNSSYSDIAEGILTAEHRFWAATLAPLQAEFKDAPKWPIEHGQRIRVGYWSPDLRNHSVFFFANPLLSHHDRDRFDVHVYHDHTTVDEQSEIIRRNVDHFHETARLTDADLFRLMRSHQLNILVELAGHTSTNRLGMLQGRIAQVQLTGLGYPPTTGLASIDGKILDCKVFSNDNYRHLYSERPILLPESFWSFDPYWHAARRDDLPSDHSEVFTYGCIGNISKITDEMLAGWSCILKAVPNARLVVRSISFQDAAAKESFSRRVEGLGLDPDRCALLGPVAGEDFLTAYNELDVLLDTFPFNGGTTSCFALYMGVLVVSRYGEGLRSRMGLSMLKSMGVGEWATEDLESYIELAVRAATNRDELRAFRKSAPARFRATALGDGKRFCTQIEDLYRDLLNGVSSVDGGTAEVALPHLAPAEIMTRAFVVLRHGQPDAAERIADYCLKIQSDHIPAHLLKIDKLMRAGEFGESTHRLDDLIRAFPTADDTSAAQLMLTYSVLASGVTERFEERRDTLKAIDISDSHDRTYASMFIAFLQAWSSRLAPDQSFVHSALHSDASWTILVESPSHEEFEYFVSKFTEKASGIGRNRLCYVCCLSASLEASVASALTSITTRYVVFTQSNVRIETTQALTESARALENADLVSIGGCRKWDRVTWRRSQFENKLSSIVVPMQSGGTVYEIRKTGHSLHRMEGGLALLDGAWVTCQAEFLRHLNPSICKLDAELDGAAGLAFEEWTHRLFLNGARLAASQVLGVIMDPSRPSCTNRLGEAALHLTDTYGFDPFADLEQDHVALSVPIQGDLIEFAQRVMFAST